MRKTKTGVDSEGDRRVGDDFPKVRSIWRRMASPSPTPLLLRQARQRCGKEKQRKAAVQPAVGDLESLKKIKEYAKEHGGLVDDQEPGGSGQRLPGVRRGVRWVDRLLEQVAFLQELAA